MCKEIHANDLKQWISENKEFQLIDVREPYEFQSDKIEGAKLIPLGQIQERFSEIDKLKPTVFVCRSGSRSGMACQFASMNGLKNSYNLIGGMMAWHYDSY